MVIETDVRVRVDDRIRLLSALLAATDWPDRGQAHGSHAHARATRRQVQPFCDHPAARALQHLIDRQVPLEALFWLMARLSWPALNSAALPRWSPPDWPEQMLDFYERADLGAFWASEAALWDRAASEATAALSKARFGPFLRTFFDSVEGPHIFVPNIGYPTDRPFGVRLDSTLAAVVPPPVAWGDNPPWPFDDDPAYLLRETLAQYVRASLMAQLAAQASRAQEAARTPLPVSDAYRAQYPKWADQFTNLVVSGAVAIYLDDYVSAQEANAYVLMQRKVHGEALLPGVVSVLRRYLADREAGKYATIMDLMPLFPKQLRVAKRIMSL